jgi:hypothetical protein
MKKQVPLISSGVAGPLGLLHLPRLWQKALLGAYGLLADGYQDVGPGYDHMVLAEIGVSPEAVKSFIRLEKPTYTAFEKWLVSQPGVHLDAATIARSNAAVLGYNHKDEVRQRILSACILPDEGKILDAVNLNNLDDWQEFHASLKS